MSTKVNDNANDVKPYGAPDANFIRRKIPIQEIALQLGLDVNRYNYARCWRTDAHQHGDRTPSLHFYKNRARCFCCDPHDYSNIDLVMKVLSIDFVAAVGWISQRFDVPQASRGRPHGPSREMPYRVGVHGGELEPLVRSGLYAKLSPSAKAVLQVALAFRDEKGIVSLSYAGFRRKAGIASDSTVRKAIDELEAIYILKRIDDAPHQGPERPKNCYRLTLEHPKLISLMNESRRLELAEIERERTFRASCRKKRSHLPADTVEMSN